MKAVWAFEPFHQDNERTKGMHRLLRQLAGADGVDAAMVVTGTEPELNLSFEVPADKRRTALPKELMKKALRKAGAPLPEGRIHVLNCETFSVGKAVDCLLSSSLAKKADLIALFTHGRKGYQRLVMGSFAETAIHRSKTSLLVCNPKTKFSPAVKSVLLASDFTVSSKPHTKAVISLCRDLGARLTVLHVAELVYQWSMNESSREIQATRRRVDAMKDWIKGECSRAGVSCRVEIVTGFTFAGDEAIALAKKEKSDLLVVAAKSSPMMALMGGSVTRQIIRESERPVLVLK